MGVFILDIEKCILFAKANNRIEGLEMTEEEEAMLRKYLKREIDFEQYKTWALRNATGGGDDGGR